MDSALSPYEPESNRVFVLDGTDYDGLETNY